MKNEQSKPKRIGVRYDSKEELYSEMKRQENIRRKQAVDARKAEAKKEVKIKKVLFSVLTFVVLMFFTIAVVAFIVWKSLVNNADLAKHSDVTYSIGENVSKVESSNAYVNGVLMVNFSDIADYLDMTIVVDSKSAKFIFIDKNNAAGSAGSGYEEFVCFTNNNTLVNINNQYVDMEEKCVITDAAVWIPFSFVENQVENIFVSFSERKSTVEISKIKDSSTKEFLDVAFKLKRMNPIDSIDSAEVVFEADLSSYEKYMCPDEYTEYLKLVNKSYTLPSTYIPSDLIDVLNTRQDGRTTQQLRLYPAKALEALFLEMKAEDALDYNYMSGFGLTVTSAYRSYDLQDWLYNKYIDEEMSLNPSLSREEAIALVEVYSAYPGTSEHQTGLCADMYNILSADQAFANEKSYLWLQENAWKFGFVLRYPEDKEDITGYEFEPWHWRYVGRKAAYIMHKNNLCLEEYVSVK